MNTQKIPFHWSMFLALAACNCGPSITFEQFPQELAGAVCGYAARCGGAESEAGCLSQLGSVSPLLAQSQASGQTGKSISAGAIQFDGAAAAACLQHVKSATCQSNLAVILSTDKDCQGMYKGRAKLGETCNFAECQPGLRCVFEGGRTCNGTCRKELQVGESAERVEQCAQGLTVEGGKCARWPQVGEACDGTCQLGLYCVAKKCLEPLGEGQKCGTAATAPCKDGLTCRGGVCAQPAKRDQGCEDNSSNACQLELTCASDGAGSQTCKARGIEGSACSEDTCDFALVCVLTGTSWTGVCRQRGTAGQPCSFGTCQSGLYCDANKTCQSKLAPGAACTEGFQENPCATDYYCNGKLCARSPSACR